MTINNLNQEDHWEEISGYFIIIYQQQVIALNYISSLNLFIWVLIHHWLPTHPTTILENPSCDETITYTTYGDHTYLDNLPVLISRWNGPISLGQSRSFISFEMLMHFNSGTNLSEKISILKKVQMNLSWPKNWLVLTQTDLFFSFVYPWDRLYTGSWYNCLL